MARLIGYIRRFPVLPILGDGESLQQPVYVRDLSDAVAACLGTGCTVRRSYNVSGAAPLTYNAVVDTVAAALGRRVAKAHLPLGVARAVVAAQQCVLPRPLLRVEQVLRLNENKVFSHEEAARDFGYRPLAFEEGIRYEIAEMDHA
ncbi:MAG: hypothetical protein GX657_10730 [Chloroflexi bacterium]|nr:hypothetical protein [Chloroflexota bacterium]